MQRLGIRNSTAPLRAHPALSITAKNCPLNNQVYVSEVQVYAARDGAADRGLRWQDRCGCRGDSGRPHHDREHPADCTALPLPCIQLKSTTTPSCPPAPHGPIPIKCRVMVFPPFFMRQSGTICNRLRSAFDAPCPRPPLPVSQACTPPRLSAHWRDVPFHTAHRRQSGAWSVARQVDLLPGDHGHRVRSPSGMVAVPKSRHPSAEAARFGAVWPAGDGFAATDPAIKPDPAKKRETIRAIEGIRVR